MDPTTLGAVLACVGVLSGSVVAYIGKRGERADVLTDQVQEERDGLLRRVVEQDAQIVALQQQRHDYLIEITRLQIQVIRLGGDPSP